MGMPNSLFLRIYLNILILLYCLVYLTALSGDSYTSIEDMKDLINNFKEILPLADLYIEAENKRLNLIEKLSEKILNSELGDEKTKDEVLDNPINIFILVKSLHKNWKKVEGFMKFSTYKATLKTFIESRSQLTLPFDDDLIGISLAFNRLATMYDLPISYIANGSFGQGLTAKKTLSAADCLKIGEQISSKGYTSTSIPWLEEALELASKNEDKTQKVEKILLRLANMHFLNGNFSAAVDTANKLLQLDPSAKVPIEFYKSRLQQAKEQPVVEKKEVLAAQIVFIKSFLIKLQKLCRNGRLMDKDKEARLKCYFSSRGSPYFKIQPLKVEDVHLKPWLALFHDVISDKEIELFKQLSRPSLLRPRLTMSFGFGGDIEGRVNKNAWLSDNSHPIIARISKRIQEITGLETKQSGESFQVVHYGIGGHYNPHADFEEETERKYSKRMGRRMATFFIYLTDVVAGGATVFPLLDVAVWPKKGSALFWYNLYKTGRGDYLTLHAACPVIAGAKWVVNKWIQEYHQEFRRPCGLKESNIYEK